MFFCVCAGGFPRITAAVTFMRTPVIRAVIMVGWLCLAVGGFLVMHDFINSLQSDVPPATGTDSYKAFEAMDRQVTMGVTNAASSVGRSLAEHRNASHASSCNPPLSLAPLQVLPIHTLLCGAANQLEGRDTARRLCRSRHLELPRPPSDGELHLRR